MSREQRLVFKPAPANRQLLLFKGAAIQRVVRASKSSMTTLQTATVWVGWNGVITVGPWRTSWTVNNG